MLDWTTDAHYQTGRNFLFKFLEEYVRSPVVVVLVGGDDDGKKKLADQIIRNVRGFTPENYQKFDKKKDLSRIPPDFFNKNSWDQPAHIIDLVDGLSGDLSFLFDVFYKLQEVGSGTVVMLWIQKDGSASGSATDEAIRNMGEINVVCASNRLLIVKG